MYTKITFFLTFFKIATPFISFPLSLSRGRPNIRTFKYVAASDSLSLIPVLTTYPQFTHKTALKTDERFLDNYLSLWFYDNTDYRASQTSSDETRDSEA